MGDWDTKPLYWRLERLGRTAQSLRISKKWHCRFNVRIYKDRQDILGLSAEHYFKSWYPTIDARQDERFQAPLKDRLVSWRAEHYTCPVTNVTEILPFPDLDLLLLFIHTVFTLTRV